MEPILIRRRARVPGRLVVVMCAAGVAACAARADQYHGMNAGAPIWGGAIEFTADKASAIAATGCRAVRINFRMDGQATWNATLLSKYDTVIQRALNNNLVVLGLLCNEAMPVGQSAFNDDPDGDGMNPYVTGFASTARMIIERYRNQVKRWELWNEPNCWSDPNYVNDPRNAGCTYILPRVYANLMAETYKELNYYGGRSVLTDSGIVLVSGGLFAHEIGGSFSHAMDYMQQVYSQTQVWNDLQSTVGRRYPWTIFGYHFYLAMDSTITTSRLAQYFNQVRSVQSTSNDPSPIFVTEFGWNSASAAIGESGQANNMRIAYNWMEGRPYIVGAFWYQWVDEPHPYYWGVTRANGSLKPSHGEFAAQQGNFPAPEPQVSISASAVQANVGQPVVVTPTVSLFPGTTASTSTWFVGTEVETSAGLPGPRNVSFAAAGTYQVSLVVRDSNTLEGRSNVLTIEVTGQQFSPVDFDQDGDVDQTDFAHLQACLSGAGIPQTHEQCLNARLDGDADVDGQDFELFQACMQGPRIVVDPSCAQAN